MKSVEEIEKLFKAWFEADQMPINLYVQLRRCFIFAYLKGEASMAKKKAKAKKPAVKK